MPTWFSPTAAIILTIFANLASVGLKISVEKDWIVLIAGDDEDRLAKLNATFRSIDLMCLIIAPMAGGFIFDYVSVGAAAIAIGAWNVFSVFLEYFFLKMIYNRFPDLSRPKTFAPK